MRSGACPIFNIGTINSAIPLDSYVDIIYDIAHVGTRERIEVLKGRASNVRSRELQRLAEATGWALRKGGKHGVMYSKPECGRLPIPSHPGAMVARTVHKILDKTEEGEHRGHGG